jgi:hypothetical protein
MNRVRRIAWVFAATMSLVTSAAQQEQDVGDLARRALADGRLACRLTTPDEFMALFGAPAQEVRKGSGEMETLLLTYPEGKAMFGRMKGFSAPFTLLGAGVRDEPLDVGQNHQIVLRSAGDLNEFDAFQRLANVSLVRVDLTDHGELLAHQVHPDIRSADILRLCTETATKTDVGLVSNPTGVVEAARKLRGEGQ